MHLIHHYLNYAVMNWVKHSITAIQPLVNLQNEAVKFMKTSNEKTLDEPYIQNHILTIKSLFRISTGRFMHSYKNNLAPSHFNQYFKSIQTVDNYPIRFATSKNIFLPRVDSPQGQCSLKFIGPKLWSEIPDHIKFQSRFDFKLLYKNYPYSLSLLVQINKWNLFNSSCVVHSLWFRTMWYFLLCFPLHFILNWHCKILFSLLHLFVIWNFSNLFFVYYCHLHSHTNVR